MKAKRFGTCNLCRSQYWQGSQIVAWLGKWVHPECKDQETRRIASEGHVEVLPDHRGSADRPKTITSTQIRRDRQPRLTNPG